MTNLKEEIDTSRLTDEQGRQDAVGSNEQLIMAANDASSIIKQLTRILKNPMAVRFTANIQIVPIRWENT